MKLLWSFGVFFLMIFSCSTEPDGLENTNPALAEIPITLKRTDTLQLKLPIDAVNLENLLFEPQDDFTYLLGNRENNKIQWLDETGEVTRELSIPKEGEFGLKYPIENLLYLNKDSILVINKFNTLIINNQGVMKSRYELKEQETYGSNRGIHLASGFPAMFLENTLYYPSSLFGHEQDSKLIFKYKLPGNKAELVFDFPENYKEGYWVGDNYSRYFTCPRPDIKSIIISFPWDNHLYQYHIDGQFEQIIASPSDIPVINPPANSLDDRKAKGLLQVRKEIFTQFEFGAITYDKYRNVYYRIMEYPLSEASIDELGSTPFYNARDFQILVYDAQNFDLVGKSERLPRGEFVKTRQLVKPEGLCIELVQKSENKIDYQIFTLI